MSWPWRGISVDRRLDGDAVAEGESGQILFDIASKDAAVEATAAELKKALEGKVVLGLARWDGRPHATEPASLASSSADQGRRGQVQLSSSDTSGRNWVPFGKFTVPTGDSRGDAGALKLADSLVEGLIGPNSV